MDEVELPDGSIIEFPDGSSPGLISTIIRRNSVPGMALYQSINHSQMTHKPEDSFFQSTNPQQAFDNTSESFASGIFNSIPNLSGMVHSLGEFSTGTRQLDTITPAISKAIGADYLNSEFTPESGYQKIVAGVGEAVADPTALIGAPYAAAKYGSKFMKGALDDVLRGGNQRGAVGLSRNGEDVAQPLPMDEASRMGRGLIGTASQRAKDIGFKSKTWNHYSPNEFEKFDMSRSDLGPHFGTYEQAKHRANTFGGTDEQIKEFKLAVKNPLRLKDVGTFHADGIALQLEKKGILAKGEGKRIEKEIADDWRLRKKYDPYIKQKMQDAGYDGVIYKNTQEGAGDSIVPFNANDIRSTAATFDPSKKNSANLLAGGAAGAVGLNALQEE